jgi:hypothetical protein
MIEYSVGELKYYYNKYDDDVNIYDVELIKRLEDEFSNLTDDENINNNIYHIFPAFVSIIATNIILSVFLACS